MAKKYNVTGLMKREYRGAGIDTVIQAEVAADSADKAAAKFEKENPKYQATQVVELYGSKSERSVKEAKETPDAK